MAGEAERVARALSGAGYFGPFGVDAFTYRDRVGNVCVQPRSEINARYTMGFAVGFAPHEIPNTSLETPHCERIAAAERAATR